MDQWFEKLRAVWLQFLSKDWWQLSNSEIPNLYMFYVFRFVCNNFTVSILFWVFIFWNFYMGGASSINGSFRWMRCLFDLGWILCNGSCSFRFGFIYYYGSVMSSNTALSICNYNVFEDNILILRSDWYCQVSWSSFSLVEDCWVWFEHPWTPGGDWRGTCYHCLRLHVSKQER